MPETKLLLNHEGRYIQGPDHGKVEMLLEHGARRRRMPRTFPIREGRQVVCVIDQGAFEAALWITDDIDHDRCRASYKKRPRAHTWLELPNAALFEADRQAIPPQTTSQLTNGVGQPRNLM